MLDVVILQGGITCLMENISVTLALITCIAGKAAHTRSQFRITIIFSVSVLTYSCIVVFNIDRTLHAL